MNENTAIEAESEVLSFGELCQAERLWHATPGLQERYAYDFNKYLNECAVGEVWGLWDSAED